VLDLEEEGIDNVKLRLARGEVALSADGHF
jgi:hypothetical protein